MKLSEAKIDVQRQQQGAWVGNVPELEGLRLKVRGVGNADWRKLQMKLLETIPRKKRRNGRIDPEENDRVTAILLRDAGLLDWEGVEDDDGKPIPYSRDKANELLTNPEYVKFRDGVLWACTVVAEDDAEDVEEAAGN